MTDTIEAPLPRTPARFFFETGYFAAYAEASIRAGNRAPFELTDAIVDRAWDIAPNAHPDHNEFDRHLSAADSADARLVEAEANYRAHWTADRGSTGTREELATCAENLRRFGAELFPANRNGQGHFARIIMDTVANSIDAYLERKVASVPAGKLNRDFTARRIKELMDEGDGFWTACSGCQEGVDGYVSEKDYPFDPTFRCQPGGGCSECGGIGVLWDDGRGYGGLTGLEDAPNVQSFNVGDWVSHNGGLIEVHTKRQITTVLGYDPDGGVQYRLTTADGSDGGMAYDCELDAWPGDDVDLPMPSPRAAEVR